MLYEELLSRLTELQILALPAPLGEVGGCMSSYDRASRYDAQTDTYIDWAANNDGSGCIRSLSDGGIVAFECKGPGVIWRIWSALPQTGHMRIFLDDEESPVIDVPFIDWFEKQQGELPPLNYSELSLRLSRGRNSWIPIPFQKYCRVELAQGWGAYYHFTYTCFPAGTSMPTWKDGQSRAGQIALAETDHKLYERGETDTVPTVRSLVRIPPGRTECLLSQTGSGAIKELVLYPQGLTENEETLDRLILRIYWDGRSRPAVESPLGSFFGGAPGYAHYRCLPMSMERGAFTCRFYMPFTEGCRVELENLDDQAHDVRMTFAVEKLSFSSGQPLRFHAKWHRGTFLGRNSDRFARGGDRWPDWPLLLVKNAAGRFCGVHLHIRNTWSKPATEAVDWWYGKWDQKTVDWWWGEGDEKFFVDGEAFPSTFGTGSEDYIGYAWAAEPPFARFDSPYACMNAMPIDGNGHTGVSRFHVADNIPFQKSFEGYIEKYKADAWGEGGICHFAAVPYWYQQADTDDEYPAITLDELQKGT